MLVLVNGLPYFGKKLVKDLNEFDSKRTYIFLDTYYSKLDKLLFFFLAPFSKLIISFNGVSDNSGALNWAMKWKKKILMQWQGSDVMIAQSRFNNKTINLDYINNSIHVSDFDNLIDELKSININARLLPFKHIEGSEIHHTYAKVSVLTYVSQNNESLYGFESIIDAAKELKEIEFHVIGSNCNSFKPLPNNVIVHGWKSSNEVDKMMLQCPIFVRMTKHDGNALTVTEALSKGCEVIWTYPNEYTHLALSTHELIFQIKNISLLLQNRQMQSNANQSNLILKKYNRNEVISSYVNFINSIL